MIRFLILSLQLAIASAAEINLKPLDLKFDRGTYFAVGFPDKEFASARTRAAKLAGKPLQNRGESHLTLLTPPEYGRLSAERRKAFAADLEKIDWSKVQIKPICIGKGEVPLNGTTESTYYLVAETPEIERVRSKYGLRDYFPHITLGFTKRDLHFEDGLKKDRASCVAELTPAEI